jgi:hypothetical protein
VMPVCAGDLMTRIVIGARLPAMEHEARLRGRIPVGGGPGGRGLGRPGPGPGRRGDGASNDTHPSRLGTRDNSEIGSGKFPSRDTPASAHAVVGTVTASASGA